MFNNVQDLSVPLLSFVCPNGVYVTSFQESPFDKQLLFLCTDGRIRTISRSNFQISQPDSILLSIAPYCIHFSCSSDNHIAMVLTDGSLHLINMNNASQIHVRPLYPITTCQFSPDGRFIAVAGADPRSLKIFDIDGQLVAAESNQRRDGQKTLKKIGTVCFSPDGRKLLGLGLGDQNDMPLLQLFEIDLPRRQLTFETQVDCHRSSLTVCAIAPHGDRVVVAGFPLKSIDYSVFNGEVNFSIGHFGTDDGLEFSDTTTCAVSPDSRYVISDSNDRTVRVWSVKTLETVAILRGHTDTILSVGFIGDGNFAVSTARDGRVLIWSLAFLYDKQAIVSTPCFGAPSSSTGASAVYFAIGYQKRRNAPPILIET